MTKPRHKLRIEVDSLFAEEKLPTIAGKLQRTSLRRVLEWAADDAARLRRNRLEQIAAARGYAPEWVRANANKDWLEAWEGMRKWGRKQNELARSRR